MARIVGYKCESCGKKDEELFVSDTEERPEVLKRRCSDCNGYLMKYDRKDNDHRWNFNDRGGI